MTSASKDAASSLTNGQLVDVATETGVAEFTRTFAANVADYNGDGLEDFFLLRHCPDCLKRGEPLPPPRLYRNKGGSFVDVSGFRGFDRHDCPFGDVNRDGRLDIFCAVGLTTSSVNQLHLQRVDHTFFNVASSYGLTQGSHGRYRTAAFIHANNDLYPDIYVTRFYGPNNDPEDPSPGEDPPFPNELWINQAGKSFVNSPGYGLNLGIGAQKDNAACNQAADFNNDGWEDLLVCGQGSSLYLFRNSGGTGFTNVTGELGVGGEWHDAEFVDLDQDNRLDLVQVQRERFRARLQGSDGIFRTVYERPVEAGLNVATGDVNGDGFVDVYQIGSCISSRFTSLPPDHADHLYLGDGSGRFVEQTMRAIEAHKGCGNDVKRIDYNNDGRDDFVVLNGRRKEAGPVQLFTWSVVASAP